MYEGKIRSVRRLKMNDFSGIRSCLWIYSFIIIESILSDCRSLDTLLIRDHLSSISFEEIFTISNNLIRCLPNDHIHSINSHWTTLKHAYLDSFHAHIHIECTRLSKYLCSIETDYWLTKFRHIFYDYLGACSNERYNQVFPTYDDSSIAIDCSVLQCDH